MKYFNGSDFLYENLILRRCPQTARQAYNKLVCLQELELRRDPVARQEQIDPLSRRMIPRPPSKRRKRLVRMYWAFRRMGREL